MRGLSLAVPCHLLEGHCRTGYLRALHLSEKWSTRDTHPLWIAQPDLTEVLGFRPLNELES